MRMDAAGGAKKKQQKRMHLELFERKIEEAIACEIKEYILQE